MVDPRSDSNFMRLQRTRQNQAKAIATEYARLSESGSPPPDAAFTTYDDKITAIRSHAFPPCEVCGAMADDPEAWETCAVPTPPGEER